MKFNLQSIDETTNDREREERVRGGESGRERVRDKVIKSKKYENEYNSSNSQVLKTLNIQILHFKTIYIQFYIVFTLYLINYGVSYVYNASGTLK